MRYFPVQCADVAGPEFTCSTYEQQGQWLNLMTYCATQENGGRIEGAAKLPDVFFQRSLAITKDEMQAECPLWFWEEDDLVIRFYPHEVQEKCHALRERGKKGGENRAKNAKSKAQKEAEADAKPDAQADASTDKTIQDLTRQEKTGSNDTRPDKTPSGGGMSVGLERIKELCSQEGWPDSFAQAIHKQGEEQAWRDRAGKPIRDVLAWIRAAYEQDPGKWAERPLWSESAEGRAAVNEVDLT